MRDNTCFALANSMKIEERCSLFRALFLLSYLRVFRSLRTLGDG